MRKALGYHTCDYILIRRMSLLSIRNRRPITTDNDEYSRRGGGGVQDMETMPVVKPENVTVTSDLPAGCRGKTRLRPPHSDNCRGASRANNRARRLEAFCRA